MKSTNLGVMVDICCLRSVGESNYLAAVNGCCRGGTDCWVALTGLNLNSVLAPRVEEPAWRALPPWASIFAVPRLRRSWRE